MSSMYCAWIYIIVTGRTYCQIIKTVMIEIKGNHRVSVT